ncbi:MAG: HAD family hydrolase, partial [Deltaproteobacteria bacterium]|nr:HAD family hydrolase [Deltaproteobacteria bacterium]
MFKGFIFDLDGTVYLSDRLIQGADRVILKLRETGKKVVFLSNKPLQTCEDY